MYSSVPTNDYIDLFRVVFSSAISVELGVLGDILKFLTNTDPVKLLQILISLGSLILTLFSSRKKPPSSVSNNTVINNTVIVDPRRLGYPKKKNCNRRVDADGNSGNSFTCIPFILKKRVAGPMATFLP